MKIKTSLNLITIAGILFLISVFYVLFFYHHPIDDCCHPLTPDPNNHPVITNTTDSDPIFGHWVFPNKNTFQPVDIAIERDGYAQKTQKL